LLAGPFIESLVIYQANGSYMPLKQRKTINFDKAKPIKKRVRFIPILTSRGNEVGLDSHPISSVIRVNSYQKAENNRLKSPASTPGVNMAGQNREAGKIEARYNSIF